MHKSMEIILARTGMNDDREESYFHSISPASSVLENIRFNLLFVSSQFLIAELWSEMRRIDARMPF